MIKVQKTYKQRSSANATDIICYKCMKGYILPNDFISNKPLIDDIVNAADDFEVTMFTYSTRWRNWIAILDLKTCRFCRKMHGKIFGADETIYEEPSVHENCRCEIKRMKAI